ncbi:MAG: hypothetical protein E5V78_31280 [Mesorhizobium sp.]|nr:MAG: hypothetical protein E5V78_31280 [Mesorhizobium sp.]
MSGGGLSLEPATAKAGDRRWIACQPGFFLPVRILWRLFGRLFLERLQDAFDAGQLRFFSDLASLADPATFCAQLAGLKRIEWVVVAQMAALEHGGRVFAMTRLISRRHLVQQALLEGARQQSPAHPNCRSAAHRHLPCFAARSEADAAGCSPDFRVPVRPDATPRHPWAR